MPVQRDTPSAAVARATVHRRFARAAIALYVAAATLAVILLVGALATDQAHEVQQRRRNLVLETQARAAALARQLGLLVSELQRLGLRSEVDLLDHNVEPERLLLHLSHEDSTFFDVGVAIVDVDGHIVWSVPQKFLPARSSVASEPWFAAVKRQRRTRIVPVQPDRGEDALVYVVAPVVRNALFSGALIGAIDLARGGTISPQATIYREGLTILATQRGAVVYPPRPPAFSADPSWRALFRGDSPPELVDDVPLRGVGHTVAAARVGTSGLVLVAAVPRAAISALPRSRMYTRLAVGLSLAVVPLALLVLLLVRSLAVFRRSEEQVESEERLRLLGEATSVIAHEVKNSLNGMRLGVDVVLRGGSPAPGAPESRAVGVLRQELQRLTDFTTQLFALSKGVVPRTATIDLVELARKVAELNRGTARQAGVELDLPDGAAAVPVDVDPTLVHIIISNLVTNAVEAAATAGRGLPRVAVRVSPAPAGGAELRVEDNGPGLPEPVRAHLFEPFVTSKPSGVGIGLTLSRKIARAHGGDLVLERAAPGACFLLTLPAAPEVTKDDAR